MIAYDHLGHRLDANPSNDLRNLDHLYELSAYEASGIRLGSVDLPDVHHGYGGVELYQDGIGACAGFSGAGWLAAMGYPNIDDGTGFAVYFEAQRRDEWSGESYEGTSINAVCKVLRALGIIDGWTWCSSWPAYLDALGHAPVLRGWDWTDGMSEPNAQGILTDVKGDIAGGHATLATGRLTSWGITTNRNWWQRKPHYPWGHDGNFYLPLDLDQWKFEQRPEAALLVPREGPS